MNAIEGAADNTALTLGMKRQLAGKAGCDRVIYLRSSAAEESICCIRRFCTDSVVACSEDSAALENAKQGRFAASVPPSVSTLTSS